MKLAILETGHPPGDLVSRFGDYPAMFTQMLGPEFDIESFNVQAGELPSDFVRAVQQYEWGDGRGLRRDA